MVEIVSSGMWHHVVWKMDKNISEETAPPSSEQKKWKDGDSMMYKTTEVLEKLSASISKEEE
jgi:hypothetical protein